ncbi:MAG: hypothetical protein WBQ34_17465 [Candidatus Acidiferrales bacterium]
MSPPLAHSCSNQFARLRRTAVSLGLFNSALMNDAVYKFKRYEDASLSYTGINKHTEDEDIGLFDTVITRKEAQGVFENIPGRQL